MNKTETMNTGGSTVLESRDIMQAALLKAGLIKEEDIAWADREVVRKRKEAQKRGLVL